MQFELKCFYRQLGKTIGLMITASHNPYADNGIKLVDPMGEMLDVALENHLTDLINMGDDDFFKSIEQMEKHSPKPNPNIVVYIGYDTRPSSPLMSLAATTAVQQTGIKVISTGLVTTPQLHYKVRATNDPLYGPSDDLTKRFIEAVKLFYEASLHSKSFRNNSHF
jgi:phosphoacetylglucosamine mutase